MIDAFKKGEYWSDQNKEDFEKLPPESQRVVRSNEIRHKLTMPNLKLRGFRKLSEYTTHEMYEDLRQLTGRDIIEVCVEFWGTIKYLQDELGKLQNEQRTSTD